MKACPLAKEQVTCRQRGDFEYTGSDWNVHLKPEQLRRAARTLDERGFFLEDVVGLGALEGFEIIYHFAHFEEPGRVTVRAMVPHEDPRLPSIADIIPAAEWHERETRDFFAIEFEGNPNPTPLLLDEDTPPGVLRKEPAKRVSIYKLFPNYDIADCKPEFLKEADEGEAAAPQPEDA